MGVRPSRVLLARALAAVTLGAAAVGAPVDAQAAPDTGLLDLACSPVVLQPTPLSTALRSGLSEAVVRVLNDLSGEQVEHLAGDSTSWIDECGRIFVADEGVAPAQRVAGP